MTEITIEESAKVAERRRTKNVVFGLLLIAIAEALILLRFLNTSIQCESLPLILYPLYPLIRCQSQGNKSSSNPSTLKMEEDVALSPQPNYVTRPVPPIHGQRKQAVNAKTNAKIEPKAALFRWPRVLSFRKRRAVSPTLSDSPCFWGHCIITPQSRLPWGVRLEHLPMPSDFEYQVSQELALVSEQLASDAHSLVTESDDIQTNISDTALKTLKAAEDNLNLQAVEYSTQTNSTFILSDGLKYVVGLLIGFLESLIL